MHPIRHGFFRHLAKAVIPVAMACAVPLPALAAFPDKPIRMVVPFAPGGGTDLVARAMGITMGEDLGQPVIVDNKPGGSTIIGTDAVAKSAPDGYTIGLSSGSVLSAIPLMTSKFPFDWQNDLTLLTLVARVREVLVVHPSVPASSLRQLVDYAKANPRKLSFGSAGIGTITHMAVELLRIEAGIDVVHVPYRGAAPAVKDLLGGHIQMIVLDVPVLLPHIRSGAVKALAVTSATRTDALPGVPTTAEAGFKTVLSDNWYGAVAPAGLPSDVAGRLRNAALGALRSAELKKHFDTQDAVPSPTTPAEFAAFVKAEQAKWGPVVTTIGIKLD